MRKHLTHIIKSSLLALFVLVLGSSTALANSSQDSNEQAARIEERKAQLQVAIADESPSQTGSSCENAQVKLGSISTRANELQRRRQLAYSELVEQLTELDKGLTSQKVPHKELSNSIESLASTWGSLQDSTIKYTSSLDDSRDIDCTADLRGFFASLNSARKAQIAVLEQNDTFQELLKDIKQQLTSIKEVVTTNLPEISLKESDTIVRN